jgi:hypothetical protein
VLLKVNKFVKLVHLVGFTIGIYEYYDARTCERQTDRNVVRPDPPALGLLYGNLLWSCLMSYGGRFLELKGDAHTVRQLVLTPCPKCPNGSVIFNKTCGGSHIGATYMGCPESFRTLKIARHCVDLVGRGKCYSLVMSLTNCVAKTALPYLA